MAIKTSASKGDIERKSPRKGTKTLINFVVYFLIPPIERKSPRKGTKTRYSLNNSYLIFHIERKSPRKGTKTGKVLSIHDIERH